MTDVTRMVSADGGAISREIFASQPVYEQEQRQIFGRTWLYVAHESQIPNKGDFVSAYMGETPVIVARGADRAIHVSVNSCPHRGVPVCRADSGNTPRFTCPYHNWTFGTDGSLLAIPQKRLIEHDVDKAALGLKRVPRVETLFGLIFASLDPEIETLDSYLGDMRFYLESFFDRFPGGMEVVGPAHKWRLKANWKLPVENQLGDIGHAPFLHGSTVENSPGSTVEIETFGMTAVPKPGHSSALRLFPEGTDPATLAWGLGESPFPPAITEYLLGVQQTVGERLSPVQERIKGMSLGVYPNFSVLVGSSTIRVTHPRGPGEIEVWSWWITPADAPDEVKLAMRSGYNFLFGPGGILEQEDSMAWSGQFDGSAISALNDVPYYYGLGTGEEGPHEELPGTIGRSYNEHYARQFYLRWQNDMLGEVA